VAVIHGPWVAAVASLAVTPVGYAVIAGVLERRWLRISSEYVALLWGDPFLAVAIGAGAWLLAGRSPGGIAGPPFGLAALICWLCFGLAQWWAEVRRGVYTRAQALAPTKFWHQLVVYPLVGYWAWAACAGGLLAPGGGSGNFSHIATRAGIMICLAIWLWANVYDRGHPKLGHPPYDWRRLRPEPRPWAPQSDSLRVYLGESS
jgi:hypothetical protein